MKISAVLLTKNEQDTIRHTLNCLRVFDEIVAIDNSTDDTPKILEEYNAKVIAEAPEQFATTQHKFHFGHAKNFAVQQARYDYVFLIDGDETVHPEIYYWLQNHPYDTVHIPQVHMKSTTEYYQLGGETARAGHKSHMVYDESWNTNILEKPQASAPYALCNWGYAKACTRMAQRLADSQHVRDGKGTWWEHYKADTVDEMLRCFENTAGKNVADLKLTMPPQWSCPL